MVSILRLSFVDSLDESLDKYNKIEILEEKEPNKDYLDKVNSSKLVGLSLMFILIEGQYDQGTSQANKRWF